MFIQLHLNQFVNKIIHYTKNGILLEKWQMVPENYLFREMVSVF